MALPKDPFILFSVINTKLRDFYPSLDALCDDMNEDKQQIIDALNEIGFEYCESKNSFVKK